MKWLADQLHSTDRGPEGVTIVVMHHPLVQSSVRHHTDAAALWNYVYQGSGLPHILADGGVDLIISGNTHTYERFLLRRDDGREFRVLNLSGRPRSGLYRLFDRTRHPRDISNREEEWLEQRGWRGLESWEIIQEEAMVEEVRNQFGIITVGADGELTLEVIFLDDAIPGGLDPAPPVRLK